MIQITKWLDPDDITWCNNRKLFITTRKWLEDERTRLSEITGVRVVIKTDTDGGQAVFRDKLK